MPYTVWVGGFSGLVQEKDLTEEFSKHGETILHVKIFRDEETHKSRHCGFVVYQSEMEAERVARMAHHKVVRRKRIVARGPAEQRSKGHSGEYEGKLGYVPTCKNDKRRLTDCIHYTNGDCTSGTECPYRHCYIARDSSICSQWDDKSCTDVDCPQRHPHDLQQELQNNGPVCPLYAISSNQAIRNDDDGGSIYLASQDKFEEISQKFIRDWAKGTAPEVRAVFVIQNKTLERKWKAYKTTLGFYQTSEEYYHGTSLQCNITDGDEDICCDRNCGICRITDSGFDKFKISTNIPSFQRFGPGFYLAPKSSKCHDYTQGAHTYRALLLCDVCPGRKYRLEKTSKDMNGPPDGHHSIYGTVGSHLNYEEIVLPKADAILPKYIVVYRKNGVHKIAK